MRWRGEFPAIATTRLARRRTLRFAFVLCALLMLNACEVNAMGKVCLFSAVHGVVLDHGQPVAGATIERSYKWAWNGKKGSDQTTTDAAGKFALPVIWGSSFLGSILPHEPFIDQTILIKHDGKSYDAWMLFKRTYDENSELGRPIDLVCRLEAEPDRHGEVFGICEPK